MPHIINGGAQLCTAARIIPRRLTLFIVFFLQICESCKFLKLLSLGLDNENGKVNNYFRFHPYTEERNQKRTALVQKSGERGPSHKLPVKVSQTIVLVM